MAQRLFSFLGGEHGRWHVRSQAPVVGAALPRVACVDVVGGVAPAAAGGWSLSGVTSHDRYVERAEKRELVARQEGLGRPEATWAALIPIRKHDAWWLLTQDERRAIFEEQSRHMHIGMQFLPAIARRLHHCRDLAEPQAFDFLTWFEYRPEHEGAFEELLAALRATEEWKYVSHEVDIRLVADP